jgi:hypothetical protein
VGGYATRTGWSRRWYREKINAQPELALAKSTSALAFDPVVVVGTTEEVEAIIEGPDMAFDLTST